MNGNYRQKNNEYHEGRETLENIYQLSNYLKCNLDKQSLAIMINLIEQGVQPEIVAKLVNEIRTVSDNGPITPSK